MPGKVWDEITYPFVNFNGCIIGSDDGLLPGQRQAIIWINAATVEV